VEYPDFSRRMCRLLRELKAQGKAICQVEPYLEILLGIHDFFAAGNPPGALSKDSIQYPVYLAERNATAALLAYYQTAVTGTFDETVAAVRRFARRDAARFRLRDSLRAQALAGQLPEHESAFVEAGVIHYPLWLQLHRQMAVPGRLQVKFLSDAALKTIGKKGRLYGPGDRLTLLYVFHPNLDWPEFEILLAARSLVYAKLIAKEEITDDLTALPHLCDELACIQTCARLTLADCRRLFARIRRVGTDRARKEVADYLSSSQPLP